MPEALIVSWIMTEPSWGQQTACALLGGCDDFVSDGDPASMARGQAGSPHPASRACRAMPPAALATVSFFDLRLGALSLGSQKTWPRLMGRNHWRRRAESAGSLGVAHRIELNWDGWPASCISTWVR